MTQPADKHSKSATKVSVWPLILAALVGGSVAFVLSQLQFSAWIEDPANLESVPPVIETNPTARPTAPASPSVAASPIAPLKNGLRVSNQSAYALRLVLLSHRPSKQAGSQYGARPAHWDFDPHEGSQRGLLLSLPKQKLTLETGDILVAFALDGSRQYWGPYVVGETADPLQSKGSQEWQLILRQ
jgi:hypothetical protein